MPLYFITAVLAERLIYMLLPIVSLPLLKHFIVISIILSTLLFICFEIFLMIMLSEKIPIHISFKEVSSEDIIADSYIEDTPPDPENTTTEGEAPAAGEPINDNFDISEPKTENTEIPSEPEENQASDPIVKDVDEETENYEPLSSITTSNDTIDSIDIENALSGNEEIDKDISDISSTADETTETIKELEIIPESYTIKDITIEEALSTVKNEITDVNDNDTNSEQNREQEEPLLSASSMQIPLESIEDSAEGNPDTAIPEETTNPLPVFDPSDPNNLFSNLAEITAGIERIKQNDANTPSEIEAANIQENDIDITDNNQAASLLPNNNASLQPATTHTTTKIDKDELEQITQEIIDDPTDPLPIEKPDSETNRSHNNTTEKITPLIDSLVVIEQIQPPVSLHSEKKEYNTDAAIPLNDGSDTSMQKAPETSENNLGTENLLKPTENTVAQLPPIMPKKKIFNPF